MRRDRRPWDDDEEHNAKMRGRPWPTGISLEQAATRRYHGRTPIAYFNFTDDRALWAGEDEGQLAGVPGLAFARALAGTYIESNGVMYEFASGVPRLRGRGLLMEGARTNLFLNSRAPVTQSVTVTAAVHTLSFWGAGQIALSGASTAGPLVGAGANERSSLVFTPSAGSLTLTLSGDVQRVQLEAGTGASSWIETAGVAVARPQETLTIPISGFAYPFTMAAEFVRNIDTGTNETIISLDDGTQDERATLRVGTTDLMVANLRDGAVDQSAVSPATTLVVGTRYRVAASFAANSVKCAVNEVLGTEDTVATIPNTPTTFNLGSRGTLQPFFGFIERVALFEGASTAAQVQELTRAL